MVLETKYRKRAMELWEEQKEETRKELIQDFTLQLNKLTSLKSRLRIYFNMWFNPNKKSPQ